MSNAETVKTPIPYGHATMRAETFGIFSDGWRCIRVGENYDPVEYLNSPHGLIVLAHQNTVAGQIDGIHPANLSGSISHNRNIVEPLKADDGMVFNNTPTATNLHWMTRRSQGALVLEAFGRMIDSDAPEACVLTSPEPMALEIYDAPFGPVIALFDSFTNDVHIIWPGIAGDVEFIESGPFPNVEPDFVDMTPEDEANIRKA